MQIDMALEEQSADFTALQVARLMTDIQYLMAFAMALAHEDLRSDFDLFDDYQAKYEFMILADQLVKPRDYPAESLVLVKHLKLMSPFQVRIGVFFRGAGEALKGVLEILRTIITADHVRNKAKLDNELVRQEVIREQLRNYEKALRIAERISNPERREAFERNLVTAIEPFVDGRYPPVKRLSPGK